MGCSSGSWPSSYFACLVALWPADMSKAARRGDIPGKDEMRAGVRMSVLSVQSGDCTVSGHSNVEECSNPVKTGL